MNSFALLLALAIEPNQQITLEQFNSLPKHLNEGQVHQFKLLKNLNDSRGENQKLVIPDLKGFSLIEISNVVYLEADGNYTHFHLFDKSKVSATRLIKEYEELLESRNFCRIHQSHMINLRFVKRYFRGNVSKTSSSLFLFFKCLFKIPFYE